MPPLPSTPSPLPPPLPPATDATDAKRLRVASALNLLLPGSGLFWLGYRGLGAGLAGAFLACFLAIMVVFLVGYSRYLSIALSENLMEGNNLEQAGAAFHSSWLVAIAAVGLVLYAISAILFSRAKRRFTRS